MSNRSDEQQPPRCTAIRQLLQWSDDNMLIKKHHWELGIVNLHQSSNKNVYHTINRSCQADTNFPQTLSKFQRNKGELH